MTSENTNYRLFPKERIVDVKRHMAKGMNYKGGIVEMDGAGTILIDGDMQDVEIKCTGESLLHISSLAALTNCTINAHDLLVVGTVEGSLTVRNDAEFADESVLVGDCDVGGESFASRLADMDEMPIRRIKKNKADASNLRVIQPMSAAG